MNDIFAIAAKKKFRFKTNKGEVATEDLFDLSLENLDTIAVNLDETVSKAGRKSFITTRTPSSTEPTQKLDIVKSVIQFKQEENDVRKARAEKAAQRSFLKTLLEKKQIAQLEGLPLADIQAQLAALGDDE
jgi:hypothetical protein